MESERLDGYYWVKLHDRWQVGLWDQFLGGWLLIYNDLVLEDDTMEEIGCRIERGC